VLRTSRWLALVVASMTVAVAAPALAQEAEEPVTLNVWVRNYTLDQDSPYKTAEAAFEAAHPNVDVVLNGLAYDELYEKLLLSKSGGTPVDVITMDTIWLGLMAEEGIAANLDDYYADFDQVSDIPDNFLASSKWKDSYYGVWLNTDVRLMLWNKDVFAQAGLDPETPPRTWDELMAMGKQIVEKVPGAFGAGFPGALEESTADRWYPLLWIAGGDLLTDDFSEAAFDSEAGVRALQLYADLIAAGVTPPDVIAQTADDVENSVFSGKYAMMLSNVSTGQADIQGMEAAEYGKHFGAAQIPLCEGCQPASGAGGYLLGVAEASGNKDLAFEFIDMATAQDNVLAFEVAQQRVPTRKSGLANTEAFKDIWYFDEVGKAAEVAHFAPWVPEYPQILTRIYTAIQEVIAGGDPRVALDAAAADVDAMLGPSE
jgi:multiple sugar transport system substrate-binding protein